MKQDKDMIDCLMSVLYYLITVVIGLAFAAFIVAALVMGVE